MTNPFGSPITGTTGDGNGETMPRVPLRNIAGQPGIFFVRWRIDNWPTKHTVAGDQAEVLGVAWVSLNEFQTSIWDDNAKAQVITTVGYGETIKYQIRQRYLIGALKSRLDSDPALGTIRLEWPNGHNSNPHYFYDDLQGDPEVLRRGVEWMSANAGNLPAYDKPTYTPPPAGAPAPQAQAAPPQGQWNGGYQQGPPPPQQWSGQPSWAPPAGYQQGPPQGPPPGYQPQPQQNWGYAPAGPPTGGWQQQQAPVAQQFPQAPAQPQGGYQQWSPQQAWEHQQQLRPAGQQTPPPGAYQPQLPPPPQGPPSAETQRAANNGGEANPSLTW